MRIEDLPTPCLILDKGILERNLKRMSDTMRRHGVALHGRLAGTAVADNAGASSPR